MDTQAEIGMLRQAVAIAGLRPVETGEGRLSSDEALAHVRGRHDSHSTGVVVLV